VSFAFLSGAAGSTSVLVQLDLGPTVTSSWQGTSRAMAGDFPRQRPLPAMPQRPISEYEQRRLDRMAEIQAAPRCARPRRSCGPRRPRRRCLGPQAEARPQAEAEAGGELQLQRQAEQEEAMRMR